MDEQIRNIIGPKRLRDSYRQHAALAQFLRLAGAPSEIHAWRGEVEGDAATLVVDSELGRHRVRATFVADPLPAIEVDGPSRGAAGPIDPLASRVRALVHFFMALVEDPRRDPTPFLELVGPTFALHYTDPAIADEAALRAWVTGRLASVTASEHVLHSVVVQGAPAGWTAAVTMKSQALFPDGSGAISRNTQHWRGTDQPDARFPRLTEILIDRDELVFFDAAGRRTR